MVDQLTRTTLHPSRKRALIWPQVSFVVLETIAGLLFRYPEYSLTATVSGLAGTAVFFIAGHGFDWEATSTARQRRPV